MYEVDNEIKLMSTAFRHSVLVAAFAGEMRQQVKK